MDTLTSKQRAHLRALAHHLKPLVQIGSAGVGPSALRTVEEAFNTRELLKVKVLESSPQEPRDAADQLAAGIPGVHIAQTIGRTVVLYRRHPEHPEIKLPG
ncbi:MAG: YhbY family RNA-binding protein [Gemmatimonadota bacterium]